jgi:hypothetical protein
MDTSLFMQVQKLSGFCTRLTLIEDLLPISLKIIIGNANEYYGHRYHKCYCVFIGRHVDSIILIFSEKKKLNLKNNNTSRAVILNFTNKL